MFKIINFMDMVTHLIDKIVTTLWENILKIITGIHIGTTAYWLFII